MFYMIIITNREFEEAYHRFFKVNRMHLVLSDFCKGTAQKKVLDYLGIEKTEKIMFHAIADCAKKEKIMHDLVYDMDLEVPGNGIAFTIPLQSIGGKRGVKYFSKEDEVDLSGGDKVEKTNYSLIIVITEKGTSEKVMEAARSANAQGGTVVSAKEVEAGSKERFFGFSIAEEKDMIYILAKVENKQDIMKAIKEKAGDETDAHAVVFSLPVDEIAGLRGR